MYGPTILGGVTYEHSLLGACVTACTKTAGVKTDYVMCITNRRVAFQPKQLLPNMCIEAMHMDSLMSLVAGDNQWRH